MKIRLILFVIATLLSVFGILSPLTLLTSYSSITTTEIDAYRIYIICIFFCAWVFYFLIAWSWIRNNAVSKKLKFIGTIFGSLSVIAIIKTAPSLLLFVSAGILLMLFIVIRVPTFKDN